LFLEKIKIDFEKTTRNIFFFGFDRLGEMTDIKRH